MEKYSHIFNQASVNVRRTPHCACILSSKIYTSFVSDTYIHTCIHVYDYDKNDSILYNKNETKV